MNHPSGQSNRPSPPPASTQPTIFLPERVTSNLNLNLANATHLSSALTATKPLDLFYLETRLQGYHHLHILRFIGFAANSSPPSPMGPDPPSAGDIDGFLYLARHVFLLPKLPKADDTTGPRVERLAGDICSALKKFRDLNEMTDSQIAAMELARVAMDNLYDIHDFETDAVGIKSHLLKKALKSLLKSGKSALNHSQPWYACS